MKQQINRDTLQMSFRFLKRDWRSGELFLLVAALLVAVSISTAIAIFSDRLQLALSRQVAEVMGADMMLSGPEPLTEKLIVEAKQQGLETSTTVEFPSMLFVGEQMQMVSAKGVESNYPLRGYVRTADQPLAEEDYISEDVPQAGEAWLEPRLFSLLGINIGDKITLGYHKLTVTKAITLEMDKGSSGFMSMSPRLMFNLADLDKTKIIQPGSRVAWKVLIAGDADTLRTYNAWAENQLGLNEKITFAEDGRQDLQKSVILLRQFLGLSSIAAMLLAGIAIAMASKRFTERRFDSCAIMRCAGASRHQVLAIMLGELCLVALLVAIPGVVLGWGLQQGLVWMLRGILPAWLPDSDWLPLFVGGATGIITLIGFGLSPLLRLQDVSPLRVLKKDLVPAPAASWLTYLLSFNAVFMLLSYHLQQPLMALILAAVSGAMLMVVSLGIQSVLSLFGKEQQLRKISPLWRLGVKRIVQQKAQSSAQLLAFTLTFMAMAVVWLLSTDLLSRWQDELPQDAPNYFAMNIQPSEVDAYHQTLDSLAIKSSHLFPIIRGRLVKINGKPTSELPKEILNEVRALHRELNMTWLEAMPDNYQIAEGEWWQAGSTFGVSVEKEIAKEIGLKIGDQITFSISGVETTQPITSLRSVEWESFQPNFFMIFPKAVLADFPATWLNSFYLAPQQRLLLNDLVAKFPSMTLIDLDVMISQVRTMLDQSVIAIQVMLAALLIAGLLVMMSVIESSIDERLREAGIVRALGGSQHQLLIMQIGEFILFGFVSGALAMAGTELVSYLLNTHVFELSWIPAYYLWVVLPLLSATVVGIAGWLGIRHTLMLPATTILKAI